MSLTDRELLELAVKAAGIDIATWSNAQAGGFQSQESAGGKFWKPLTDDGDALRLAVKLQLTICNEHVNAGSAYCANPFGELMYPVVNSGNYEAEVIPEDYAATRRAIVLAAAEIGKAMQEGE